MADGAEGTRAEAPGWRQKAAFWLMLATAAYWIAGGAHWVVTTGSDWLGMAWAVVMAALTVIAALGTRTSNTGWHLFARIVLLGLIFRDLVLHGWFRSVPAEVIPLAIAVIAALVLLGRSGLGPDGGPFSPTRFRGLLVFMILAAGVMSFASFSVVVEGVVGRLRYPDSPLSWQVEVHRLLYLFVYVVTAIGLYKMRAAALLVPLLLGAYLLYLSFVAPVWGDRGAQPSQEVVEKYRWGAIRYASFVLVMVVPFLCALAWLRLRARRERGRLS